jgi:transposase
MSGKKRDRRQWTAEEKVRILEEARQPATTVAEVLRRHQVDATTFYRWEREAKAAMLAALGDRRRARADDKDHEIERLQREVERKSRIIAEVVEENLGLKRGL